MNAAAGELLRPYEVDPWRPAHVVALSTSTIYAGPCLQEIVRVQAEINAKLGAKAASGPSATESTAATMHHQPTREAETKLGTIRAEQVTAVIEAMTRAREADRNGDQSGCEQALSDVRRIVRQ